MTFTRIENHVRGQPDGRLVNWGKQSIELNKKIRGR